jgi:hypothetical protein
MRAKYGLIILLLLSVVVLSGCKKTADPGTNDTAGGPAPTGAKPPESTPSGGRD